ncbi:uncharacterized mitochondrial protein AtMg00820-like [Humulus lupulus]|uniref:uncharacterized mitochondrial protein AtMg00820-like n=1 Tax=Humulus lupulus TaxID=3486 RepID=UPI002B40EC5C|nr:uncharacterized mitochondrial protein AtMg00820-like [Humulus lupulus]
MESINVVFSDLDNFASFSEEEEIHTLVDTFIMPVASQTTGELSGYKIEEIDATIETSETFDVSSIPENIVSSDLGIHHKKGTTNMDAQSSSSILHLEPKFVKDALKDEQWISAMQDEFQKFERNEVWTLVPHPLGANIIGTKWIFRNKTDEVGNVVCKKAILVAQGYTQIEGVDFEETFALMARL